MKYIHDKSRIRSIAVINMLTVSVVSLSGLFVVASSFRNCQKAVKCGYLCKATLGNIAILIPIGFLGVTLSASVFLSHGSNIHRKCYSLVSLFLIKSIEIGGLFYCEACLMFFPFMTNKDAWCISISPVAFILVIGLTIIFDIHFLAVTVKMDEDLRNTCGDSSWGAIRRVRREHKTEDFELQELDENLH